MTEETTDPTNERLPAPKKRRRWLTVMLALLIFGAGLASGAAITVAVAIHRLQYLVQHPEEAPGRIASRLQRRLDLDDDQKKKIEAILARRQSQFTLLRRQFRPLLVMQLNSLRDEISGVLTEPQRNEWQAMYDELLERWLPSGEGETQPQASN